MLLLLPNTAQAAPARSSARAGASPGGTREGSTSGEGHSDFLTGCKPGLRVSMSNTNLIESRKKKPGKLQDFLQLRTLWERGIAASFPQNAFLSPSSSFHEPLKETILLLKACELGGNGHVYVSHQHKQKQYRTLSDFISSAGLSNTTTRPVVLLSGAAR